MVFRLDPNNPEDVKLLEKKLGKEYTQSVLADIKNRSIDTIGSNHSKSSGKTESLQIDHLNKPKRNKYGGNKVFCKTLGKWIRSEGEHATYHILLNIQKKGKIQNLTHEEPVKLEVDGQLITTFLIDFQFDWRGKHYYVDYKHEATITKEFKLKKKLFEATFKEKLYLTTKKNPGLIHDILYN